MKEIKCPNCHTVFEIDTDRYDDIVKQIRDDLFNQEIQRIQKSYDAELALSQANAKEQERIQKEKLLRMEADAKLQIEQLKAKYDLEIQALKARKDIEVAKATQDLTSQLQAKQATIDQIQLQAKLDQAKQKELANQQLQAKDELIAYYKDMKLKLSTKMLGESLEQHCEIQFNQLRATGFQNSYFEKDNDASSGSKGDYIFKEMDENGNEIISIMFEMKNEADQTVTKKTNESFLKELDKDRRIKKCEYAVLVSLLEPENELYNGGIVDMSHRYEKMYVIRPQFFIPLITILRNAALKNVEIKKELMESRNQNIDIANFEEKMNEFKEGFGKNVDVASKKFQSAIDEIDKTITHLQKVKENLMSSDRQLNLANKKVDGLSIRSLTYKNPTMQKMFKDLKNNETK